MLLALLLVPSLFAASPPKPPPPPVPAAISALHLHARPDTPSTDLTLTATIQVYEGGYVDLPLGLDQLILWRATLDGRPVPLPPAPSNRRLTADLAPGTHILQAEGLLISLSPEARLSLPPATPAVLHLDAPGLDVSVEGGVPLGRSEVALLPTGGLALAWKPETPPPPRPHRLVVESAVGISVESGGTEGQARLRYQAINGPVEQVVLRLGGPLELLEASGALVQDSQQQGDRLIVSLVEPVEGDFTVDLTFRGPTPQGGVPLFVPEADRAEGWVSLLAGEDGYLEQSAQHMEPVLPDAVPAWAQGLAPGNLLAAWHYGAGASPSLSVKAQRWEALESPGTLIDEATLRVAHTDHGRTLTRARLMVRNDRRQYLGVTLPPHSTLLVARVAGRPVEVVREGDQILVPLEKSIETLTGLISFPVEVSWLSETPRWRRRGEMTLATPTFDAPVAQLRWSLLLPPGAEARRVIGQSAQVVRQEEPPPPPRPPLTPLPADDPFWSQFDLIDPATHRFGTDRQGQDAQFPEEIILISEAYSAPEEPEGVDDAKKERSMELWTRAYSAYKENDFEQAEELLEESLYWDATNSASQALMSNVGVVQGESEASGAQAERIKALARSRSSDAEAQQRALLEEAEQLYRAGDIDRAIEQYNEAIVITDQLANLEDSNAYVQKASSSQLRDTLKRVEEERKTREVISGEVRRPEVVAQQIVISEPGFDTLLPVTEEEPYWDEDRSIEAEKEDEQDWREVELSRSVPPETSAFPEEYGIDSLDYAEDEEVLVQLGRDRPLGGDEGSGRGSGQGSIHYPSRTEIDFEDIEIEGELVRPQGQVLLTETTTLSNLPVQRNEYYLNGANVVDSANLSSSDDDGDGYFERADVPPPPPPAPPPMLASPDPAPTPTMGVTLERDNLERIPAGRSYQSAVLAVARVSGGASSAAASNGLDDVRISMELGRGIMGSRRMDAAADNQNTYEPLAQEVALAEDVMVIPGGVTSSQWIVLVPDVGLAAELERQLLGADEGVGARVRYRLRRGR